jgi:hypothetical protein
MKVNGLINRKKAKTTREKIDESINTMFNNVNNKYTKYIRSKLNKQFNNVKWIQCDTIKQFDNQDYLIINGTLIKIIGNISNLKLKDIGDAKMKCLHRINDILYFESKLIKHLLDMKMTNNITKDYSYRYYRDIILKQLDKTCYITIYRKDDKEIYKSLIFKPGNNRTRLLKLSVLDTNPKFKAFEESIGIDKHIDHDDVIEH